MADRKPLCDSTEHLPPAAQRVGAGAGPIAGGDDRAAAEDRKSTRLNSSHSQISYAVFCLKKKKAQSDAVLLISIFLFIRLFNLSLRRTRDINHAQAIPWGVQHSQPPDWSSSSLIP